MDNKGNDLILRKADSNDCMDLFAWRNNLEVRKNSFNTAEVHLEEHKKWFFAKITRPENKIYIAVFKGMKAGVIRFEPANGKIKVSVHLNPGFFGRGLGSMVIKAGTEKYFSETSGKIVTAEIKKDNIASVKAFEKAGYRYSAEREDRLIYEKG